MGVEKLWKTVAPLCQIVDFYTATTGQRVGEDGSVWLHALAAGDKDAAIDLLQDRPQFASLLRNFEARLQRVLDNGVTPVFVFDGTRPGAKSVEDVSRAAVRQAARAEALALLRSGDRKRAEKSAVKAVQIPDGLLYLVVHKILRPRGIGTLFILCSIQARQ